MKLKHFQLHTAPSPGLGAGSPGLGAGSLGLGAGTWFELGRTELSDFPDVVGELNDGIWENEHLYSSTTDPIS